MNLQNRCANFEVALVVSVEVDAVEKYLSRDVIYVAKH